MRFLLNRFLQFRVKTIFLMNFWWPVSFRQWECFWWSMRDLVFLVSVFFGNLSLFECFGLRAWIQNDVKAKMSLYYSCGVGCVCFSMKLHDQCWLVWIRDRWQGLHRICPSSGWQPCSFGSGERSTAHSWRKRKKRYDLQQDVWTCLACSFLVQVFLHSNGDTHTSQR